MNNNILAKNLMIARCHLDVLIKIKIDSPLKEEIFYFKPRGESSLFHRGHTTPTNFGKLVEKYCSLTFINGVNPIILMQ